MRDRRQWPYACEDQARHALLAASAGVGTALGAFSLRWDRSGAPGLLLLARPPAAAAAFPEAAGAPGPVGPGAEAAEWYALADSGADGAAPADLELHRALYRRRADILAILRTRPVFSTALACSVGIREQGLPVLFADLARVIGPAVRCSELPSDDQVLAALDGGAVCLLADSGLLTTGASLQAAAGLADAVETMAQIHCQVLQLRRQPGAAVASAGTA